MQSHLNRFELKLEQHSQALSVCLLCFVVLSLLAISIFLQTSNEIQKMQRQLIEERTVAASTVAMSAGKLANF